MYSARTGQREIPHLSVETHLCTRRALLAKHTRCTQYAVRLSDKFLKPLPHRLRLARRFCGTERRRHRSATQRHDRIPDPALYLIHHVYRSHHHGHNISLTSWWCSRASRAAACITGRRTCAANKLRKENTRSARSGPGSRLGGSVSNTRRTPACRPQRSIRHPSYAYLYTV